MRGGTGFLVFVGLTLFFSGAAHSRRPANESEIEVIRPYTVMLKSDDQLIAFESNIGRIVDLNLLNPQYLKKLKLCSPDKNFIKYNGLIHQQWDCDAKKNPDYFGFDVSYKIRHGSVIFISIERETIVVT